MDIKKLTQSMMLTSGLKVKVAVLDSGVNPTYPPLKGKLGKVFDCQYSPEGLFVREMSTRTSSDRNGHGSVVQSCILNVAPDAQVDHFRILDEFNNCDSALLCYTLDYILEKNYDVINLSLGTRNEEYVPWLVSIMKRAYEKGITVVAASSSLDNSLFPGRFTYCVSVQAMLASNPLQLQFHSGSVVEFSALGLNIPVTMPNNQTLYVSGSSYAAAHVTGLVARATEIQAGLSPLDTKLLLREYALNLARDSGNHFTA